MDRDEVESWLRDRSRNPSVSVMQLSEWVHANRTEPRGAMIILEPLGRPTSPFDPVTQGARMHARNCRCAEPSRTHGRSGVCRGFSCPAQVGCRRAYHPFTLLLLSDPYSAWRVQQFFLG